MNLTKMMAAAGIGCGEGCICAKVFSDSLSEAQKSMFTHIIEAGAKKRLQKIKKTGKNVADGKSKKRLKTPQGSFASFIDQMFNGAESADGNQFSPIAAMLSEALQQRKAEMSAEPYTGDLTADQIATLAALDDPIRAKVEEEVRQAIAAYGDGDPRRVLLKMQQKGIGTIISAKILDPIDEAEVGESMDKETKAA